MTSSGKILRTEWLTKLTIGEPSRTTSSITWQISLQSVKDKVKKTVSSHSLPTLMASISNSRRKCKLNVRTDVRSRRCRWRRCLIGRSRCRIRIVFRRSKRTERSVIMSPRSIRSLKKSNVSKPGRNWSEIWLTSAKSRGRSRFALKYWSTLAAMSSRIETVWKEKDLIQISLN